jgi:YegS C-terminal NAD kinase beta sandwich-like domain
VSIRKGEAWGSAGSLDPAAAVYASDAAAAAALQQVVDGLGPGADPDEPLAPGALGELGLIGGDLHRTLGAPRHDEAQLRAGEGMRFPCDVGLVELDDHGSGRRRLVFVAHLVAHQSGPARVGDTRWWRGRTLVVLNAAFVGDANLGPRAHPDDGRLDVTDGALSWTDRRRAVRRHALGSHVPHPQLAERRTRDLTVQAERPLQLELDGVAVGRATELRVRCWADAVTIVV